MVKAKGNKAAEARAGEREEITEVVTGGTSRQQTLAARKSAEQERRKGKSVAAPTNEESSDESEEEQVPQKKPKTTKGKSVAVERDRKKTPSVEELYDHLMNGNKWTPTRFADLELLRELELVSDIEAMLIHLKMPKLLTMAYPFYQDASAQFLSSLVVTYFDTRHVRQGWGKIKFKVDGREYHMNFRKIGEVMGFQDQEEHFLPKDDDYTKKLWSLISGNKRRAGSDKNTHIRHPSIRYLHRMLVHAFYPRKQAGTVTDEDLKLICPAILPYTTPSALSLPSEDIYAKFGMVGFFVSRLEHYKAWIWSTTDDKAKIGIGNMITPILQFNVSILGEETWGPSFIDSNYLRIATYFRGRYEGNFVYQYSLKGRQVEVLLPNKQLTSLENRENVRFDIPQEAFFEEHGHLDPMAPSGSRRSYPMPPRASFEEDTAEPVYGPPRYYFKPYDGVLAHGALREAHEHIDKLQRWNKAQDRAYYKLKTKYKELKRTMKKQAKASAKVIKKMVDVLVRGGVAGCNHSDFVVGNTSAPQPQNRNPSHTDRQTERARRNFEAPRSASGNQSPSFSSSSDDSGDEAASVPPQIGYYITYPQEDEPGDNN